MKVLKNSIIAFLFVLCMVRSVYATTTEANTEILESIESVETMEKIDETDTSDMIETEVIQDEVVQKLTIHFSVKFQNEDLYNKIKGIDITIPNGIYNEEGEVHREEFTLLKSEGFLKDVTLDQYSDLATIRAKVSNDSAYVYDIVFEGYEKLVYYGEEIRNTVEIDLTNTNEVDLVLFVTKNEEKIEDSNLITETAEFFEKVENGKYGESREQEIKASEFPIITDSETETEAEDVNLPYLNNEIVQMILIILGTIVCVSGAVLLIIRKRVNSDD